MSGREGGKKKPLKAAKKDHKELDDDDKVCIGKEQNKKAYFTFSGLPSQAERRAEEVEGGCSQGSRQRSHGRRWHQEIRQKIINPNQ